jgi:hypothetical protein
MSGHIPNTILLEILLEHPDFSDFQRKGSEYRNAKGDQCLREQWFKDYKSGESKLLFTLAKERGLLNEARRRAGMPEYKQQPQRLAVSEDMDNSDKAQQIWEKADFKSEKARAPITRYLTDVRKIPPENYQDLLGSGWLRWDAQNNSIIYPISKSSDAETVRKIQRIFLDEDGNKTSKKMLGSDGLISVIPVIKPSAQSDQPPTFFVFEGLENALSIRNQQTNTFLLSNGKSNLKHVPAFLPEKAVVVIISDHDANEHPAQNGQTDAAKLRSELIRLGYQCTAWMPAERKTDANDALQQNALKRWVESLIDVPELERSKDGFYLHSRSELTIREPDWLVQEMFEHNTLCAIVGESGCGKSFVGVDLACCVATGTPWHGKPTKRGTAVYLAGEGKSGLGRRIGAWEHHHGVNKAPLMISSGAIDLGDSRDELPKVISALHELASPPDLIVIDTLARHYSGDENSATEMSAFISNLDKLRNKFNATVVIIHHSGKDPARGPRGSSSFRAALDHEILVTKPDTGVLHITCEKAKDAEPFVPMSFKLTSADVADVNGRLIADTDGNAIRSCVLEQCEYAEQAHESKWTEQQALARDVFLRLSNQNDSKTVDKSAWYRALVEEGITHSQTKHRLKEKMVAMGLFSVYSAGTRDEYFVPSNYAGFSGFHSD